jgi:hypothetical protein
MTPRLLKIIASVVLVLSLSAPAFAIAPLILTAAEMLWPTVVLSGCSMLIPKSHTANVPSFGRAASSGLNRNLLAKVGPYAAIAVAGYLAYDELRNKYDPNTYTSFHDLLYKKNPALSPLPDPNNPTNLIGKEVAWMESGHLGTAVILTVSSPYYPGPTWGGGLTPYIGPGLYIFGSSTVYAYSSKDKSSAYCYIVTVRAVTSSNQYILRTDAEVAQELTDPATGDLSSKYLNDIDNMIVNNPSSVQLPSSFSKDLSDAKKQVATDSITSSDQKKVASLQSIRDAALAQYNANPSAENKAALDKAEADLAAAESEQAQHNLQQQQDEDDETVEYTHPDLPALKKIDLSPLLQIGSVLNGKFPFTLLQTVSSMASSLVASPAAPSFTISFPSPFNYEWVVTLSAWDSWAATLRFLIGAAFLVSVSMAILRRWV